MSSPPPGVFYPTDARVFVGADDIDQLACVADGLAIGRARLCAHESPAAPVHEMLIVQTQASYVRPHRHLAKAESLLLLDGEVDAVFFDDDGAVRERLPMRPLAAGGPFYYRIPPKVWHSLVIRSPRIVMQEVTQGPFRLEDSEFAPWSPPVTDARSVAAYVGALRARSAA